MSLETKETKKIVTVLGSAGDFRLQVDEGTEGAVTREYETSDGKKGIKHELVFGAIEGSVTNVEFFDGDYGKNLLITFSFTEDEEPVTVSLGCNTQFGEDALKKFPNIDLDKEVRMEPFAFTDENGKPIKGINITQDSEKVTSAYWDNENKKNLLGYPEPDGDTTKYDADDWKVFFTKARKHTIAWVEENVLPKYGHTAE